MHAFKCVTIYIYPSCIIFHMWYIPVYICIYLFIYYDHILYILFALVTHLILFLAGPSRATCPTSYSSWMQRHSVCRLEKLGHYGWDKEDIVGCTTPNYGCCSPTIGVLRAVGPSLAPKVVQTIRLIVHEPLTVTDGTGDPFHDAGWPLPVLTMTFPLQFSWEEKIPRSL